MLTPWKVAILTELSKKGHIRRDPRFSIAPDDGIEKHQGCGTLFPRGDRREEAALLISEAQELIGVWNGYIQSRNVKLRDELHHVPIALHMLGQVIVQQVMAARLDAFLLAPEPNLPGKAIGEQFSYCLAIVDPGPTGRSAHTSKEMGENGKQLIAVHLLEKRRQVVAPGGASIGSSASPGGLHQVGLIAVESFHFLPRALDLFENRLVHIGDKT